MLWRFSSRLAPSASKAFSIFHLLYRLSPEMVAAYTDEQATGRRRLRHSDWI